MPIAPRWSSVDPEDNPPARRTRGGSTIRRALVLAAVLGLLHESPTMANPPGADEFPRPLEPRDRDELLEYARATWRSFERMAGPIGLPADRLEVDDRGGWTASHQCSPTDVASYIWSALGAHALGLVGDAEVDRRLGVTLDTLARMERDHGFFFNLFDARTGASTTPPEAKGYSPGRFLSTVDNGWLAASLIMLGNARPTLRDRAGALLAPMDFGFFYVPFDPADPARRPGQFRGGYHAEDKTSCGFYNLINTEPRIVSYVAIARGQVPPEHYYRLYRTLPARWGKQAEPPGGEVRTYAGVPVFEGSYRYRGSRIVPSWGGSMFEALMVPLLVPEETWAPRSWGVNHPLYSRAQVEEGLKVRGYGYWGFSPCQAPEVGYQTFGVDELGSDPEGYLTFETHRGRKSDGPAPKRQALDGVVTPHASFLALRYAPVEAMANLRAIEKDFPTSYGEMGFRDAVDVKTGEVTRSVLALDQGMILAAIANALADDAIRHAFADGPIEARIRPLIAPEVFSTGRD